MGYRPQRLIGNDEKNHKLSREIWLAKTELSKKENELSGMVEAYFSYLLAKNRILNETRDENLVKQLEVQIDLKLESIKTLKTEIEDLRKCIDQNEKILWQEILNEKPQRQPNGE